MGNDTITRAYEVPANKVLPGSVIFDLHQTKGVTLEISAMVACERKMIIGWAEFIRLAVTSGWDKDRTMRRCRQACKDAGYNGKFMAEIGRERIK